MSAEPRSVPEILGQRLAPLRRLLSPRYWPEWWRSLRFTGPLAARSLRRYLLRNILVGACVSLSLAIFLLLSSYHQQVVGDLTARTRPLALPADAVVILNAPIEPGSHVPLMGAREAAPIWTASALSRWGRTSLTGLPAGILPRLEVIRGRLPEGEGQAMVSATVAQAAGIEPGDVVEIRVNEQLTHLHITGVTIAYQHIFDGVITTSGTAASLAGGGESPGNAYLVWGFSGRPVDAGTLRRAFPTATSVVTRDLPRQSVAQLLGQAHAPGRTLLASIYLFSGLGVLNVMLLSYLQRRRYLGLLKAQGVRGHETAMILLTEGAVMAAIGAAAGIAVSGAGIWFINGATALYLQFPWRSLPWALALSLCVFYLGASGPAAMCRRATIYDLLYRRNLLG